MVAVVGDAMQFAERPAALSGSGKNILNFFSLPSAYFHSSP